MAEVKPDIETFAKIKVIGVGGSGNNAVNRMILAKIRGVEFVAVNTDVQALHNSHAPVKIHIGKTVTRGLGAGMDPEQGRRAAEESANELREVVKGADMVFVTCGLGGGTGTGAAPLIAELAKEAGALTVAVVTKPFGFEGMIRRKVAESGYADLASHVDTIITIPNDRVLQIADKKTSLLEAFQIVDDVLRQGVQGMSELITIPGIINVDFADVRAIMANQGTALMGIGKGTGDNRATDAAKAAIASPLLEVSIDGAHGILFMITGSANLGMHEVSEAAEIITGSASPEAKVIFGAVIDETLKDEIRITVIATGFLDENGKKADEAKKEAAASAPLIVKTKIGSPVVETTPAPRVETPAPPVAPQQPAVAVQVPPSPLTFQTQPIIVRASPTPFASHVAPAQAFPPAPQITPYAPVPSMQQTPQQEPEQVERAFQSKNIMPEDPTAFFRDQLHAVQAQAMQKFAQQAAVMQDQNQQQQAMQPRYTPQQALPPMQKALPSPEEDLEIPAFIRKKML